MVRRWKRWAARGVGFSGGFVPAVGDVILVPMAKAKAPPWAKPFIAQGAKASIAGGVVMGAQEYHKRWNLSDMAARNLQTFTLGAYKAPESAWDKTPKKSFEAWRSKSKGGSSSKSSQQNGGRKWGKQSHPPWAQSGKLGSKRGKAKRGFRAGGKARASRPPYCPVHKRRHWCWFTSKRKTPFRRR